MLGCNNDGGLLDNVVVVVVKELEWMVDDVRCWQR
jgi:hypothetical protein